ncbi:acyltransferase family protein [Chryseobacterium sp. Hurlbut01]|uniref:acyltransferase family protein n=1 Tax=Chryseobacterium sp. Hurlbut01 TaxID=1681828 RepID=UPI00067B2B6D|nr:acyltransferase [Chryseobacterium sp. Hurlbut01]KNB60997.1 hypothetical protein AC804_17800 [Chryseobacterium sp. Hurlbut01]
MKKIDYLDALRGLAIIGVLFVHCSQYGKPVFGFFKDSLAAGAYGVQLFFITSAFTLFYSNSVKSSTTADFFIRRFFRIAPMFYLGIIYYLWQNGTGPRYALGDASGISTANIISTFTFTNSFNPYWINSIVPGGWSIAIEFLFYALLPLFIFRVIKNLNSAIWLFLFSILISFICNSIFQFCIPISDERLWGDFLIMYFPAQLPVFSIGIIAFFLVIKKESIREINVVTLLIISTLTLLQLSTPLRFFSEAVKFSLIFGLLTIILSLKSFKIIVNPVIILLGKLSFSIYLSHFAVLHWMSKFDFVDFTERSLINYIIRLFIVIIISVFISIFTYTLIEKPFIRLGSKIIHFKSLNRSWKRHKSK